jgi:hypothetical protein
MNKDEALRLALEALEEYTSVVTSVNDPNTWIKVADGGKPAREAITAIEAALEAKDEPVGQLQEDAFGRGQVMWFNKPADQSMLYTTPPQRIWVELTDDEIESLDLSNYVQVVRIVQDKLKQKNT